MIGISIIHVGRYTFAQQGEAIVGTPSLSFNISGLRLMRFPGYELRNPGPFLYVHLANERIAWDYGKDRENYVAQFTCPTLFASANPHMLEIEDEGRRMAIPRMASIPEGAIPIWKEKWLQMEAAFRSPLPVNTLQIKLWICEMINEIAAGTESKLPTSPAQKLRGLIDQDAACRTSVEMLSRQCGYSPDHLRELFRREFGMSPREYRIKRRIALSTSMLAGSSMSIKEIALRAGFKHASHFCSLYREQTGRTPSEDMRNLRQRVGKRK